MGGAGDMKRDGYIEVWEKIDFIDSMAVGWQKSYDGGKTWTDVDWKGLYNHPPFVLTRPSHEISEVTQVRWEPEGNGI
jgi:hypothetical protein